jgi:hypothetical protein
MKRLYRWLSQEPDPFLSALAAEKKWPEPLTERQMAQLQLEAELRYQEVLRPGADAPAAASKVDRFVLIEPTVHLHRAWDTHLHRRVNLQYLPLEQARLAAMLRHPFIIEILGIGGSDASPYLVLEPIDRRAKPTLDRVRKLCHAVEYAQSASIQFDHFEFVVDRFGMPRLLITPLSRRVDPAANAENLKKLLPRYHFSSTTPGDLAREIGRRLRLRRLVGLGIALLALFCVLVQSL